MERRLYDKLHRAFRNELSSFRLQHQVEADNPDHGLMLIDALSCGDDISTGAEEIERMVDNLLDVLADEIEL